MTVEEALAFFDNVPTIKNKIQTLFDVGLGYVKLGQPSTELSGGEAQRIKLATELSKRGTGKTIYILDEPIAGVDPAARDFILRTIISNYEKNALVLISTHLIADVEPLLDEILFLKNGHIVLSGNAEKIRSERGVSIDQLFREEFEC